jgi:aspartate kinase
MSRILCKAPKHIHLHAYWVAILSPMTVEKFGGAVLRTPLGFKAMSAIIQSRQPEPCMVVVSAIGSTTRSLAAAAACSLRGAGGEAAALLDAITMVHADLAGSICADPIERRQLTHALTELVDGARRLCRSVEVTRQCSARTLDRIMATGEDLARRLATAALQGTGIEITEVDARTLIMTDDQYGSARPLPEATRRRVRHQLEQSDTTWVTQGFVASTESGETTTMGRESSNLSASLLASCLDAKSVTIWTDVEGVQTADPMICPSAFTVRHLQYDQARIAASYGLKLLYPTMIDPAELSGIPIRIASALAPDDQGTRIDAKPASAPVMIATVDNGETSAVTILFVSLEESLRAIMHVLESLGSSHADGIDVITHMHDRAATIVVPTPLAPFVVRALHSELYQESA